VTGRDAFVIDFEKEPLLKRMRAFVDPDSSDEELVERFNLNPSDWWNVANARESMPAPAEFDEFVRPILYRPFDTRLCFYHPSVFMSPRRPVMRNIDAGLENIILVTSRMTKGEQFQHVTVTRGLAEAILVSSKTSNNAIVFPLYLYPDTDGDERLPISEARRPNFSDEFIRAMRYAWGVPLVDGRGDRKTNVGADDVLDYIIAILHSPSYRDRYADALTRDFPRITFPSRIGVFSALAELGAALVANHLLETPARDPRLARYEGRAHPQVKRVGWSGDTVWLDAAATKKDQPSKPGTIGFHGVPEAVWNFHVGGYQVCHKWLKDRKGRTLSDDDIAHYQKIVVALSETIRIMKEIDEVIEAHGGWPDAFAQGESAA
jgi:predicted helicase